jgi:hypothetical protein
LTGDSAGAGGPLRRVAVVVDGGIDEEDDDVDDDDVGEDDDEGDEEDEEGGRRRWANGAAMPEVVTVATAVASLCTFRRALMWGASPKPPSYNHIFQSRSLMAA